MTQRKTPHEEGRDWSKASTSPGTPTIANTSPEPREQHETDSSLQLSEGTHTADILISDF